MVQTRMDSDLFAPGVSGGTVGDMALGQIRSDIIRGGLRPGQRLRLDPLRQTYGASVSTLREVLSRLAAEGFVVAEGQRGFEVAPVRISELRELGEMRILLECHALRRSLSLGKLDWEARVVSAFHMLKSTEGSLIGGGDIAVEEWVQYDWNFHQAIVSACDMPALLATHANIFERYIRYHLLALDFRGAPAAREHERLRDLVLTREVDQTVALLAAHIRAGMEHVIASGRIPA
ncbi:GntR family transcriptional regulator [Paracoccus ravus]|uniref:GntR family transcriptional regulator n=1 Tax=Paracoccus ravus TaxID=2447760 RepID=UPI001FD6673C|nr:GntR family transcriptional regulator [Paracoccus ravus]